MSRTNKKISISIFLAAAVGFILFSSIVTVAQQKNVQEFSIINAKSATLPAQKIKSFLQEGLALEIETLNARRQKISERPALPEYVKTPLLSLFDARILKVEQFKKELETLISLEEIKLFRQKIKNSRQEFRSERQAIFSQYFSARGFGIIDNLKKKGSLLEKKIKELKRRGVNTVDIEKRIKDGNSLIDKAEMLLQGEEPMAANNKKITLAALFSRASKDKWKTQTAAKFKETSKVLRESAEALEGALVMIDSEIAAQTEASSVVPFPEPYKGTYSSRYKTSTYTLYSAKPTDPIFIFIHGGGWKTGDKDEGKFIPLLTDIRNSGFNVYTINYRLSGDAKWPAQINDVKCMLAYVASSSNSVGDKNKIVIGGNSAGAHLSLMAAITPKSDFDDDCEWPGRSYTVLGVVAASPAIDLTQMSSHGLSFSGELLGYLSTTNPAGALAASPINYASVDDPSVLILSGGEDELTQASDHAKRLSQIYLGLGKTIEWTDYPTQGHDLDVFDPGSAAFERFTSFVSSLSPKIISFPESSCSPQKAEPYAKKIITKARELGLSPVQFQRPTFLGCDQRNMKNGQKQDELPFNLTGYDGVIFYNISGVNSDNTVTLPAMPPNFMTAILQSGGGSSINLDFKNTSILGLYIEITGGGSNVKVTNASAGTKYEYALTGGGSNVSINGKAVTEGKGEIAGESVTYKPGNYNESIIVDGRERTYLLHVPTGFDATKKYPLALLFHGGGGTGAHLMRSSGFDTKADREGFIAVAGDGIRNTWNRGGDELPAEKLGIDDVKFVRELIAHLKSKLPVDDKRIYSTGMSNGASFSYRLACEMSDTFAAVGPVASSLITQGVPRCNPAKPISIVHIHGINDSVSPYEGGTGRTGEPLEGVPKTLEFWASKNGCSGVPVVESLSPTVNDGTRVERVSYGGCKDGTSVLHFKVYGMGHTWPPTEPAGKGNTDPTSKNLNATDVIWEFFKAHSQAGIPPSTSTYKPGDYKESITVDGRERTYLLHVPIGLETKKQYPLVVLLHGGGGEAELAAKISGMSKKADKEKFIVLYPEGAAGPTKLRSWNAGDCCAYASRQKIDDIGFIKTLVEKIKKGYPVDSRRVYVSGMSNGAILTHRVACELSDIFAGAAAVAGTIQVASCHPSNPVAFIAFHGTADDNVPYNGGPGTGNFTTNNVFLSAEKTASDWAARNQCAAGSKTEIIPPLANDGITIEKISYGSCKNLADTILYRLNGGKHYWPGGEPGLYQEAAIPTKAISATDVIWEFFKSHPKQ